MIILNDIKNIKEKDFGNKANNIILMYEFGLNVPETWIIDYKYPMSLIREQLNIDLLSNKKNECDIIYKFFKDIPDKIYNEVHNEVKRIKQKNKTVKRFAVRSSHSYEDGNEFSFPGVFKTELNLSNTVNITNAIFNCWSDCFVEAVREYSSLVGIKRMLPCSIIMQEFIASESSGVVFKSNDYIYINSTLGMAKSIVDGTTGFDHWTINSNNVLVNYENSKDVINLPVFTKTNPKIHDLIPFNFDDKELLEVIRFNNKDNFVLVELNNKLKRNSSLSDKILTLLIEKCEEISKILDMKNYDIEWTFNNKQLYILQCRKLTREIQMEINYNQKFAGLPLVAGKASGVCYYVETEDDAKNFPKGGILVSKNLNGSVLLAANKACGCILESKSPLSHSAIIARELGIPAVGAVNLDDIEFNKYYTIDGSTGYIKNTFEKDINCKPKTQNNINLFEKNSLKLVEKMNEYCSDIVEKLYNGKLPIKD